MPLHSAVASARLKSILGLGSNSWSCLSQGTVNAMYSFTTVSPFLLSNLINLEEKNEILLLLKSFESGSQFLQGSLFRLVFLMKKRLPL